MNRTSLRSVEAVTSKSLEALTMIVLTSICKLRAERVIANFLKAPSARNAQFE